jgi:hypothetical protein
MLPLWEGWDEYAHFAWLQHWNDQGTLPRTTDRISREIDESMRVAPLPRELRWIGAPYLIYPDWWALPAEQRAERERELRELPVAFAHQPAADFNGKPFVFYEAQQPPLFYWLAAPVLRPFDQWNIHRRVVLIRLVSVLFASLAIPLVFLAAPAVGEYCAALLAVAPGLMIDAAHVSNDGLAIGIGAVFLWLMMREKSGWISVGVTLGLAILTKASMLFLAPILITLWIRRRPKQLAGALALGFAIGGWWYVRNVSIGMPLTGWQESVSFGEMVRSGLALLHHGLWLNEIRTIAKSFTWFGAWSFISLRSWMYLLLEGLAAIGIAVGLVSRRARIGIPLVFTAWFCVAITAGAAAYYAVHQIAGIPGWYLWPIGGALAILLVAGLGRWSVLFVALLALTDLYGVTARMMPYYAGLAQWNHGSVASLPEAMARLHVGWWMFVAWVLATAAIPAIAYWRAKTRM